MRDLKRYPYEIRPLSEDDGGGYLISFTDFNVCISDGNTKEEALENGYDALAGMIEVLEELGRPIPEPSKQPSYTMPIPITV